MVTIEHLNKYIREHSHDFRDGGQKMLEQAQVLAESEGPNEIGSRSAEKLLGMEHASVLLNLVTTDPEYLRLTCDAIMAMKASIQ